MCRSVVIWLNFCLNLNYYYTEREVPLRLLLLRRVLFKELTPNQNKKRDIRDITCITSRYSSCIHNAVWIERKRRQTFVFEIYSMSLTDGIDGVVLPEQCSIFLRLCIHKTSPYFYAAFELSTDKRRRLMTAMKCTYIDMYAQTLLVRLKYREDTWKYWTVVSYCVCVCMFCIYIYIPF